MPTSPLSILSLCDFNGDPLSPELLHRTFGELMTEHGYVLMCNTPDTFDPVAFCRGLGRFVPNYSGAVVGDVRPEPGMDDVYHAGNTRALTPHTEGYDFTTIPPRYITLWCVTPCHGAGGETTLADTHRWLPGLTDEQRDLMRARTYEWKTTEGIQRLGLDLHTKHPVLEETGEGTIIRFSCNNLIRDDNDPIAKVQEQGKEFFDREHVAIDYDRADMLVWDNWRMLHSRNAFTDTGRHLRRIQIAA
jgi:alpha-ketoglutarate-dependent taurine dioxygenase